MRGCVDVHACMMQLKRDLFDTSFLDSFQKVMCPIKRHPWDHCGKTGRNAKIHHLHKVTVTDSFSDVQNDYRKNPIVYLCFQCVIVVNFIPEQLNFVHLTIYTNFKLTNLVRPEAKC